MNLRPRTRQTPRLGAPPQLDLQQRHRAPRRGQTPHPHHPPPVRPGEHPTGPAPRPPRTRLDPPARPHRRAPTSPISTSPFSPSMAVPALPSPVTWVLLHRVRDTAILRPRPVFQVQADHVSSEPTMLHDEEPDNPLDVLSVAGVRVALACPFSLVYPLSRSGEGRAAAR